MKTTHFPIRRVNRLRRAAIKAREIPDTDSGGSRDGNWSFAHGQANDLLGVFETLWLKPGFVLYAYIYRGSHGGNGWTWAVPADSVSVGSRDGPALENGWAKPPPGAVPLMQAIEGDGSPWSYLSASILSREAAEFGAFWHGLDWSVRKILSKPPRQSEGRDSWDVDLKPTGHAPVGNWTWYGPVPRTWEPTLVDTGTTKEVVLHIFGPVGGRTISRATDTYRAGSYDAETKTVDLCSAGPGIVF